MKRSYLISLFATATIISFLTVLPPRFLAKAGAGAQQDFSPKPDEQQLPQAMHSEMKELPSITVARENADLVGSDNRVLQAAVDYIASLGGGIVEIGEGQYLMYDSLHLRSNVTVRGQKGKTILRKAAGVVSALVLDGDFGEEQVTVIEPAGFEVGCGVAIWDSRSGGFHDTVARITGRNGNTFSIDKPLMADYMVHNNAKAATVFPVISAYNIEGARVKNLIIDGNKESNVHLTGCRGAGIFLYRAFGTVIQGCVVRNYNGDGISFQQSNDVTVIDCISEDNASLGIHPGSGSQRPLVRNCTARRNGTDGLFLCWRVRHGLFEDNVLENNGRYGISIGHKDSDNLLRRNLVCLNAKAGVFFRNESLGMAAHRNRLEDNIIENNGTSGQAAGIHIRGQTNDLVFINNTIRDTRPSGSQTQTVGILIEETVGEVTLEGNNIEAQIQIDDRRVTRRVPRAR
ncbi:MAG: nitrous oxide reductase family maturation protein NosD [Sedimentisphaerales bacterium]